MYENTQSIYHNKTNTKSAKVNIFWKSEKISYFTIVYKVEEMKIALKETLTILYYQIGWDGIFIKNYNIVWYIKKLTELTTNHINDFPERFNTLVCTFLIVYMFIIYRLSVF